jgi:hypothetical protein
MLLCRVSLSRHNARGSSLVFWIPEQMLRRRFTLRRNLRDRRRSVTTVCEPKFSAQCKGLFPCVRTFHTDPILLQSYGPTSREYCCSLVPTQGNPTQKHGQFWIPEQMLRRRFTLRRNLRALPLCAHLSHRSNPVTIIWADIKGVLLFSDPIVLRETRHKSMGSFGFLSKCYAGGLR